jgi:hypothetical protein
VRKRAMVSQPSPARLSRWVLMSLSQVAKVTQPMTRTQINQPAAAEAVAVVEVEEVVVGEEVAEEGSEEAEAGVEEPPQVRSFPFSRTALCSRLSTTPSPCELCGLPKRPP